MTRQHIFSVLSVHFILILFLRISELVHDLKDLLTKIRIPFLQKE